MHARGGQRSGSPQRAPLTTIDEGDEEHGARVLVDKGAHGGTCHEAGRLNHDNAAKPQHAVFAGPCGTLVTTLRCHVCGRWCGCPSLASISCMLLLMLVLQTVCIALLLQRSSSTPAAATPRSPEQAQPPGATALSNGQQPHVTSQPVAVVASDTRHAYLAPGLKAGQRMVLPVGRQPADHSAFGIVEIPQHSLLICTLAKVGSTQWRRMVQY